MAYPFNGLSLIICQNILEERLRQKGILEHRRSESMYNQTHSGNERTRTQAELDEVNASIALLDTAIAAITDVVERRPKELERSRLNGRKLTLEIRLDKNAPESAPDQQFDLAVINFKLAELEVFLADLQAEITALGG